MSVAVLRDDRGDPLRVVRRQTEAHRRAVVEDGITSEPGTVVNTVYVKSLVGQISAPEQKLEKVVTTGQYL